MGEEGTRGLDQQDKTRRWGRRGPPDEAYRAPHHNRMRAERRGGAAPLSRR